MDRKRRAMWDAAFAKKDRGEDVPPEEHFSLLRDGLFEGRNGRDALEEAKYVIRFWCHGFRVDPVPWRWESEAESYFGIGDMFDELCRKNERDIERSSFYREKGARRQAEKLRNMIEASEHDPDYWDALNWLVVLHRARDIPLPEELEEWAIELHKSQIRELRKNHPHPLVEPPRPPSNEGNPCYAMDNRNSTFASAFGLLGYLGLKSESVRRRAIAEVHDVSLRTAKDAIEAGMQQDSRLPKPWECWPLRT